MKNELPTLPAHQALLAEMVPYREKWHSAPRPDPSMIEPIGAGEESVWDYPRPPQLRATKERVRVMLGDIVIADSMKAYNIIETAGAPVHYIPPIDVQSDWLRVSDNIRMCEWKGAAAHYDLLLPDGRQIEHATFVYPEPLDDLERGFTKIAGYFGFYPAKFSCFLDDERVLPQPSGYYAGWVSRKIKGPIKGVPGSENW